ncbi:MAG: cell division protein SepF [Thermoplasmata archaeon]|nr:cell division protein SepF [Thermoplasmata archaeon]
MIKMIFGKDRKGEYIDLEEYGGVEKKEAKMFVKVAEIQSYDDVKDFANYIYEGNLLILDVSPISIDDIELERVINEFKRITEDIDGDIAGMDRNHIIVTPSGVKIDRRKLRKF